jgi:putative SOS response-associated peptidase YedK
VSRYSLILDGDADTGLLGVSLETIPAPYRCSRYNISRGQAIIVLRSNTETNPDNLQASTMQWGFTPHWIHAANPALQPLTVAAEKVSQPYFRDAFRQRRCLIPASGFYAWQGWENGPAAPYYVQMRDRQTFFMAGIWDNCEGVDRVAMITTAANALVQPIHDRMPAIIAREQIDAWLRGDRPQRLLLPYSAREMDIHQVSRKIFCAVNEGPDLITPVAIVEHARAAAQAHR